MAYRNIFVSNAGKLSVKNGLLCIEQEEKHTIPFEDISVLVIESNTTLLSASVLSSLADNNIATYFCNDFTFQLEFCCRCTLIQGI